MFPVRYWILILTLLGNSIFTCVLEALKHCIPMMLQSGNNCVSHKPWCNFSKEEQTLHYGSPIVLNESCSSMPFVNFGPRYQWADAETEWFYYSQLSGHLLSSIPGGILAENVGPYTMLLYTTVVCAVLNLLRAFFVAIDWRLLVAIEFSIGVHLGIAFVSLIVWTVRWAPPNERGVFVVCQASNPLIGHCLKMFINLTAPTMGWRGIFYNLTMVLLIFWVALWMLGSDNPVEHKKISSVELTYIKNSLKGEITSTKCLPPITKILLNKAFWLINALHFGFIAGTRFLTTSMEAFSHQFVGIPPIKFTHIQIISSSAYLVMAVSLAILTDFIRKRKMLCNVAVVRILVVSSHLISGSLLLFIGVAQCNKSMVLALYYVASITVSSALITCYKTIIELSPNFAGTVYGFVKFFSSTAILLEINVRTNVSHPSINTAGWTVLFLIGGGCMIFPAVVFICMGVVKKQKWNSKPQDRVLFNQHEEREDIRSIIVKQNKMTDGKKILKKKVGSTDISAKNCRQYKRINTKDRHKMKRKDNRLNFANAVKVKPKKVAKNVQKSEKKRL